MRKVLFPIAYVFRTISPCLLALFLSSSLTVDAAFILASITELDNKPVLWIFLIKSEVFWVLLNQLPFNFFYELKLQINIAMKLGKLFTFILWKLSCIWHKIAYPAPRCGLSRNMLIKIAALRAHLCWLFTRLINKWTFVFIFYLINRTKQMKSYLV